MKGQQLREVPVHTGEKGLILERNGQGWTANRKVVDVRIFRILTEQFSRCPDSKL